MDSSIIFFFHVTICDKSFFAKTVNGSKNFRLLQDFSSSLELTLLFIR